MRGTNEIRIGRSFCKLKNWIGIKNTIHCWYHFKYDEPIDDISVVNADVRAKQ